MVGHGRASDLRCAIDMPASSDLRQTQRQALGFSMALADASRHIHKQVILSDQPLTCHAQMLL